MIKFVESVSVESISALSDDELLDMALRLKDAHDSPQATEHTLEIVDTINGELHNRTFYKVTGAFKNTPFDHLK